MKKMTKKERNTFWRSAAISLAVFLCIIFGIYGICTAYCGIRQTSYGDYRPAIQVTEDGIKILDFEF